MINDSQYTFDNLRPIKILNVTFAHNTRQKDIILLLQSL